MGPEAPKKKGMNGMKVKKWLAAVLSAAMLLSVLPAGAMALTQEDEPAAGEVSLMENIVVTDSEWTPEGDYSFYLYCPTNPHDFDMMSGQLNAVIYVYPDKPYTSEEEVYAALEEMGLIDIAESSPAYIVVPNPINGESWSEADLNVYYESQFYLAGGKIVSFTPPTGEYTRRTYNNLQYIMAEGEGATFVNNVLSQNANRIAGILTFGGEMDDSLEKGVAVPAYLVNADEATVAYYKAVNGTDTQEGNTFVNSSYVQKKVVVAEGADSFDAKTIANAWGSLLSRTTRASMSENVVINTMDMSEWTLMGWPNYDELGLTLKEHSYNYQDKDYVVYDYVPSSYTGEEAVPLVVLLHGFTEDPLCPAATCGWADKCAEEGFILVAPDYLNDLGSQGIALDAIMQVVEGAQKTYNIDASRIYLTGFSMGGMNTMMTGFQNADVFAAVAPMAGMTDIRPFQADPDVYDLPTFVLCGTVDANNAEQDENGNVSFTSMNGNVYPYLAAFNGIELGDPDYSINPWGYKADKEHTRVEQDISYVFNDFYADGYEHPMLELVTAEGVAHACSNVYADFAWDFMSKFARGEDGSVIERNATPFQDLKAGSWYEGAVNYGYYNGLFVGTSDTTFEPDRNMTRAELVQVLYAMNDSPEVKGSSGFQDVKDDAWYAPAVTWARENGIVAGRSETIFDPNTSVTREEMTLILMNYAGKMGYSTEGAADLSVYPDGGSVKDWAKDSMSWAVANGLISGTKENGVIYLAPGMSASRAQMAVVMMNFDRNLAK